MIFSMARSCDKSVDGRMDVEVGCKHTDAEVGYEGHISKLNLVSLAL